MAEGVSGENAIWKHFVAFPERSHDRALTIGVAMESERDRNIAIQDEHYHPRLDFLGYLQHRLETRCLNTEMSFADAGITGAAQMPRVPGGEPEGETSRVSAGLVSKMPSPRAGHKRTNEEIYANKTGVNGDGKDNSASQRPRTAPEQGQKAQDALQHQRNGFPIHNQNSAAQSFSSTIATLSTQSSNISTTFTIPDQPQTFISQLQELQANLDEEYERYEQELEQRDHKEHLEDFDWDDLEARYLQEMESAIEEEREIQSNLAKRYRNMLLWMQTSSDREAQRAIKRLRTRIAYVQSSEEKLHAKEDHYEKVLGSFQQTMALLSDS